MFRRKLLFLAPMIGIPILTVLVTFLTGSQYTVNATLWVEQIQLIQNDSFRSRMAANELDTQIINDRIRTRDFRLQIMERSGLLDAIEAGQWPQVSALEKRIAGIPVVSNLAYATGLLPPVTRGAILGEALRMVGRSFRSRTVGQNLVVITYKGSEPELGRRIIEEILEIHREEIIATRNREADAGQEFLTRQLVDQEARLAVTLEELTEYERRFPPPPPGLQRPTEELRELQSFQQAMQLERARYLSALERIEDLKLRSDTTISTIDLRFRIVDPPLAGGTASVNMKKLAMMTMLGITLGGMLGTVGIVFSTWRDGLVRTRADVERLIETPLIVEIPDLPSASKRRARLLDASLGLFERGR
ncbi:MAG: hypothetical protein IIC21_04280 [Chloroflexi bacterium]|nr:hypothetical protein [Chloroflexota bacterium]